MSGYGKKDAQKDTDVSRRHVEGAWHYARDDSGRGKDYADNLRDPSYKDQASSGVSDALNDAGITDIQSLPEGYVSDADR
ncbi:hypothetical protein A2982_01895 [candidate division WWE3 bacterium RIFCSPLOWO2_01_FULL_39_13]|uniref:Uncharacterized protein n=1 Tax=candidate division WWE3 bacterium RIFCSPLOWO2_01_FULL_39_13 TaxID=1802624 RepID=A0A1F4V6R6_UNCKA|nr:MAG: hypothetical protein A2982_01895 [candidate division WWE3 bacterium RIFCSPLOWO2_01_FULL_39_13]